MVLIIDLCITNSPGRLQIPVSFTLAEVIILLFFCHVRLRIGPHVIETRQFKHLNRETSINYLGPVLICILIPMKCGVYGKKCFLAASINKHHLNPKEFEKNDLHGLLESYWTKSENEISLKRRQSPPTTRLYGINLGVQETRQITQLNSKKTLCFWQPGSQQR